MENPGIDPGTSRMQSGRSTSWANSPTSMVSFVSVVQKTLTLINDFEQPFVTEGLVNCCQAVRLVLTQFLSGKARNAMKNTLGFSTTCSELTHSFVEQK